MRLFIDHWWLPCLLGICTFVILWREIYLPERRRRRAIERRFKKYPRW